MSRVINARVKKDIQEMMMGGSDDEEDLWELERQMKVFNIGEKGQRKHKRMPSNDFDYTGQKLTKDEVVEKCMILAGDEARKHSKGPKKKENQT